MFPQPGRVNLMPAPAPPAHRRTSHREAEPQDEPQRQHPTQAPDASSSGPHDGDAGRYTAAGCSRILNVPSCFFWNIS
jgi:hypothetical protein